MNDVVIALLNCVAKLLDPVNLYNLFKTEKNQETGARLFMLFAAVDEVYFNGEVVVNDLESYVRKMTCYLQDERQRWALGGLKAVDHMSVHIDRQLEAIEALVNTAQELDAELRIVDPEGYAKLRLLSGGILIEKKQLLNALDSMIQLLRHDKVPLLGPSAQDLLRVANELVCEFDVHAAGLETEMTRKMADTVAALGEQFELGAVAYTTAWDESVFRLVKEYLATRNPRAQLQEIHMVALQIREAVSKVFAPDQILWLVGSSRFRSAYRKSK
ncbi:hypothetical protein OKW30_001822 [Paraburkholderia sp. Clong3]|uniref:hypothetical protein n=1 Tax=Paraburkholderia sp. Clong3 TaxID=2991061 RepID=UPI003D1B5758